MGRIPNPGSDKAIARGCKCPVMDNCHGKGYMGGMRGKDGKVVFILNPSCEVHKRYQR